MAECPICFERIDTISGYSCNYCTGMYCADHRLPEQHDCPGLSRANTLGPEIRRPKDEHIPTGQTLSTTSSGKPSPVFWGLLFLVVVLVIWSALALLGIV